MTVEMETDAEYQIIAKKIIYNSCTATLADRIYEDTSMFGTVVNAVMLADWEFNGKGNIYGYRKQRAQWAIYKIIQEMGSMKGDHKTQQFSQFEHSDFYDKKQKDFVAEIEQKDYIEYIRERIETSDLLSENEKKVLIGKFLEDKTILEISEELEVRGEAVRQTLKRAMTKMGRSLCV